MQAFSLNCSLADLLSSVESALIMTTSQFIVPSPLQFTINSTPFFLKNLTIFFPTIK